MTYIKKKTDKWVKVPIDADELSMLQKILKHEKKNLRIFFQESVKNKLTSVTLIV